MRHTLHFLVTILAVLFASEASAGPIDSNQALRNAQAFLQEKGIALQAQGMRRTQSKNTPNEKQSPYYVFNIGDEKGFVIASGDDRTPIVLGYSDKGSMDLDSLPENVRYWLGCYEEQIRSLDKMGVEAGKARARRVATSLTPVGPLLTTEWGQIDPYYNTCPIYPKTNNRCVTGCVATAMAQLMYYHRQHSTREVVAEIPGYLSNDDVALYVDPIEKGAPIDWDNMKNKYYGIETETQELAVAELMRYCGSSVKMEYAPYASSSYSSNVPQALVSYFDYDEGIEILFRTLYSDTEWETMIYEELTMGNPVYYSGNSGEGHAFVIDGFDESGYVHVNWGWSGDSDGYFLLSTSSETDERPLKGYTTNQCAILSAVPNGDFPRLTNEELSLTSGGVIANLSCLSSIPVELSLTVANHDEETSCFEQSIGLFKDGKFMETVIQLPGTTCINTGATHQESISLELASSLSDGTYTLVPMSRAEGTERWRKNAGYDQCVTVSVYGDQAQLTTGQLSEEDEIITFANSEAGRICLANWDTNGDGGLSKGEAAAVKSLGNVFKNNSEITSFEELQYFTGLTGIGDMAFQNCSALTSVIIPEGVTHIGESAFASCALNQIMIPNSVISISSSAFADNKHLEKIIVKSSNPTYDSRDNCHAIIEKSTNTLITGCKNTVIPDDIVAIGADAFHGCAGLTTVTIPENVRSIGSSAFSGCENLQTVNFTEGLTVIGSGSFSDCTSLKSIVLPQGLQEIASNAFHHTALESVVIPAGVETIKGNSFSNCGNLTSIEVAEDNPYYDSRDHCNAIMQTVNGTAVLVVGCKTTVIPQDTKVIGDGAFQYCEDLEEIELMEGVTRIGDDAFGNCSNLESITLPSTIVEIGSGAFCNILYDNKVVVRGTEPPTITGDSFTFDSNAILYVPEGCADKYKNATYWKDFKCFVEGDHIIFSDQYTEEICLLNWDADGDGVLTLAEAAAVEDLGTVFYSKGITSFDELVFFTGLTSIGEEAFMGDYCLESIILPANLQSIGSSAFEDCSSLRHIIIPNSVWLIKSGAFSGCGSLETITLNIGLSKIMDEAFYNSGIKSLHIPSSVKYINEKIAGYCNQLKEIEVDSNDYFDSRDNCNGIINSNTLIQGCQTTVIPNTVTSIGLGAFYGCTGLNSMSIPENVVSIGREAFAECDGLEMVSIPSKTTAIGDMAFYLCSSLNAVVVKVEEPLSITYETFSNYSDATLYVPMGCRDAYMAAENWKLFGEIKEMTGIKGDVNQDGEVSVYDVTKLIDVVLGKEGLTIPLEFTDLNGDGEASVYDVTKLIDIILKD